MTKSNIIGLTPIIRINIAEISRMVSKHPTTIRRWRKVNRPLFNMLCRGYLEIKFDEVRILNET